MEIRQQLVSSRAKTYAGVNDCVGIAFHETANKSIGAGAIAHANLQSRGNVRDASWHWQVDDKIAVQSFPHTVRCWHAGDGRTKGGGNYSYIAIEVCVNADGDVAQAWRNAAELARYIQAQVPTARTLKQHNAFSGKNCPAILRSGRLGFGWSEVVQWVNHGSGLVVPTKPPAKPVTTPATKGADIMAQLPILNWSKQSTKYDAMTERVQALLKAADCYAGALDGRRGPLSLAGLMKFQRRYNCGGGGGKADMSIGAKTWQSLLLGKTW